MKYLLDTGVFLWSLDAVHRLNEDARRLLSSASGQIFLSAASAWEIAIKFALGKLRLPKPPAEFVPAGMLSMTVRPLDVTHTHSLKAGALPMHHDDPFDRMLVAQALAEDMVLLTGDRAIEKYEVRAIFCGK